MQIAGGVGEYAGCLFRRTWARDRESQLDYIAPKTSSIDGDPMLTIGGKEHRSGARMNVNPLPVNASGFHHPAEILLAASPAGALMPAAVNRVPVGHVVTATHCLLRQRVQCIGPLDIGGTDLLGLCD